MKLKHPWPRSNIPYKALELLNKICCLESAGNAPRKKPHLRLISPIYLSTLELKVSQSYNCNSEKTDHLIFTNKRSPEYHNTHAHKKANKQANLATDYTLRDCYEANIPWFVPSMKLIEAIRNKILNNIEILFKLYI